MAIWPSVVAPPRAEPTVRGKDGSIYAVSSFGVDATTFGPDFRVRAFFDSERFKELEWREKFYTCKQHDHKIFDFDSRMTRPGSPVTQPFIGGNEPTFYVPLQYRRPATPYRLPRVIVDSFTEFVFGHGRWPGLRVVGDPQTQDFVNALAKAQRLPSIMTRARTLGGSIGTVGLSWRFYDGRPRTRVHKGQYLYVHEWEDREELIPAHVSEIYQFHRDEWEPKKKQFLRQWYWQRRDWTPTADITFVEAKVTETDPYWVIDDDPSKTVVHNDGFCHFVWVQNLPDDSSGGVDGFPDYEALQENFGSLDVLNSVVVKGGVLNLDPTLLLKVDPNLTGNSVVRKGSENALRVGESGDARYLELQGSSISAGSALTENQRKQMLEVAQCVSPDPDTIAAAGTSSLALKMIYAKMLGKCDILRTQWGLAIERLLEQQVKSSRMHLQRGDDEDESSDSEEDETSDAAPANEVVEHEDDADDAKVEFYLRLPPRVNEEPVLDEQGNPTGEVKIVFEERLPGEGGDVEIEWGPYFPPTEDDREKKGRTLSAASGGKPIMSHKAAIEKWAAANDLDPEEEWAQIVKAQQAERQAEIEMFPPAGGEVEDIKDLPDAAVPEAAIELGVGQVQSAMEIVRAVAMGQISRGAGSGQLQGLFGLPPERAELVLGDAGRKIDPKAAQAASTIEPPPPADVAKTMTVDELRDRAQPPLPPLPDPVVGAMTLTEFEAKFSPSRGGPPQGPSGIPGGPMGSVKPRGTGTVLTATDRATILTVNEAREDLGLPLVPEPEGSMTVTEFKAARARTLSTAAAAEAGKAPPQGVTPPGAPEGGQGPAT